MVLHTGAAIAPPALALAHAPQPALPGAGDIVAPKPIEPTVLGLAPERLLFSQLGLSERVVLTLQNVRATSMRSQYGYKWGVFQTWCLAHQADPTTCPMLIILQFLQDLFDEDKSTLILKVYLAAILACHVKIDSVFPGAHFLAGQFLKWVQSLWPPLKD